MADDEDRGDWSRFAWFNEQLKANRFPRPIDMMSKFRISRSTAKRTIERFEQRLSAPILYDERRKGYYYPNDCHAIELPPMWLTEPGSDLVLGSLALLARSVKRGDPLAAPLASLIPGRYACLTERLVVETLEHHPPDAEVFVRVVQAVASDRTLKLRYRAKARDTIEEREVEPLVMYQFSGNWYVYAHCRLRDDRRLFSLDRIEGMPALGDGFSRHDRTEQEDPRVYLMRTFGLYKHGQRQWARIRFTPHLANWVKDQCWHQDQIRMMGTDGSIELRIPFAGDGIDLVREVLKFGREAELLEPAWLRDEVRSQLVASLARYEM